MRDIARSIVYAGVFLIPFIPLIVLNSFFFPFITGKNFAFRIIVEVVFAAWVIIALYEPQYRPKFSWIIGTFAAFIGVIFVADIFGQYPLQSFWSNFERMEGFVTLAHTFAYFIVASSVLTTDKMWRRFWYTSFAAALIMVLYGFGQIGGSIDIRQSSTRLDGLMGNSAYLAMYMCFHIFMAAYYLFAATSTKIRAVFAVFILLFLFIMIETETRGTALGLVGGGIVASIYIALFGAKENPILRKTFLGVLAGLVIFVGAVYALRDTTLITSNDGLNRITHTRLSDLNTRLEIWTMAFEGVKERPILGWGQSNFNYVFNKYYDPSLYGQEAWFDRVHNIVMDWLIAAGVVGTVAYFSIFGAAVYYLVVLPLRRPESYPFTVVERGILLGLLVAYVFHNFFVFDNLVSYFFYATILAMVHSRVSKDIPRITLPKYDSRIIENIALPVVGVSLLGTLYFVNMPGILASRDIIHAFSSSSPEQMLAEFDEALSRNSFGDQEIREQMTRQVQSIIQSPQVTEEVKQRAVKRVEEELLKQAEEKPGDARVHVFISSFYRMSNNLDGAIKQLEIARSLSPEKQQIMFEQGLTYLQKSKPETALQYFKEAYDLAPEYTQARVFYATAALYAGKPEIVSEVINDDRYLSSFAASDLAVQAAYQGKHFDLLEKMFMARIKENPADPQLRVNLAVVYHESGNTDKAVSVLKQAAEEIPSFKTQADQFIKDLEDGRLPGQKEPAVTVGAEKVKAKTR